MSSISRHKLISLDAQGSATSHALPGSANQNPPVINQLPFPDLSTAEGASEASQDSVAQFSSMPVAPGVPAESPMSPVVTGTLADSSLASPATSALVELETEKLPATPELKTPVREPVVIRSTGKKSAGTMRPPRPQGKRLNVHLAVGISLIVVLAIALTAVMPGNVDGQATSPFQSLFMHSVNSHGNNTMSIAAQVATATAVTQDGYDAGGGVQYADVVSAPAAPVVSAGSSSAADSGSLARFTYGQCTYWANMRYHQLTGHWVAWLGNADEWAAGAAADGWVVSNTPNPNGPSIIVLQPYVQGAGGYGHVAVVEHVNSDGSVNTSNWNWGGGWTVTTYVTFYPGSGVSFVWY